MTGENPQLVGTLVRQAQLKVWVDAVLHGGSSVVSDGVSGGSSDPWEMDQWSRWSAHRAGDRRRVRAAAVRVVTACASDRSRGQAASVPEPKGAPRTASSIRVFVIAFIGHLLPVASGTVIMTDHPCAAKWVS